MKKTFTVFIKANCLFFIFMLAIPDGLQADCSLNIGWEPWGIYQYQDENGKLQGLDVELITAISKIANCNLTWRKLPWKRHLLEIENGRIDLATGASKNPEREEYAYFSLPYRTESVVLFVRKGETHLFPFENIKDIMNTQFRLGTTLGYDYGEAFAELMKNKKFASHIQQVREDTPHYKKIVLHRIDGFLGDTFATIEGLRRLKLLDKVEKHPLSIYSTDIFICWAKNQLRQRRFKRLIRQLKQLKPMELMMQSYTNT